MEQQRDNIMSALDSVKAFIRDVDLLYWDLAAAVKDSFWEKKQKVDDEFDWSYGPKFAVGKFEHVWQRHVKVDKVVKGFSQVISVLPEWITTTQDYNKFCEDLEVNIGYPLILVYGVFEPIDLGQFNAKDWFKSLTGIDKNLCPQSQLPMIFEYNKELEIITGIGREDPTWFSRAKIKITPLLEINNQEDVKRIAEDIRDMRLG